MRLSSNRDDVALGSPRNGVGGAGIVTVERIGLTRGDPCLPALSRQVEILTEVGRCGAIVEADASSRGQKRLDRLIRGLGPGSTLCVVSLEVFHRPLHDLVRLLRDLAELSITVAIVSRNDQEVAIRPHAAVADLLRQLAAFNGRASASGGDKAQWYGRAFRPAAQFTRHQVLHARKLYGDGMSLRAIGLIFQTSPEEVSKVIG